MILSDELRFAVGTFTRVPVPAPRRLSPRVAGRGVALGPIVGTAIALTSGSVLLVTGVDLVARLLSATLVVALAAWLTRGLHWDGLADVADGLGSGAPPQRAGQVMRQSDIGTFGVLTLVLTVTLQAQSIAQLPAGGAALAGWVLAVALGRFAVAVACGPWFTAARPDGLGALVIGAVDRARLTLTTLLTAGVAIVATTAGPLSAPRALFWGPLAAILVAVVLGRLARRRFGGSSGDVLGATAEATTTAVLLLLALD